MTEEQAQAWLRQVDGLVYRNADLDEASAWVAVVRAPSNAGHPRQIIVAFGSSLENATDAAEEIWQRHWRRLSATH